MTGTETHKSILRRVVAALAVSGMVVSLAGRASGATFEKAINPNYSYTEDVQQTSDGGYVVGATFSNTTYVALIAKLDSSGNLQWQKQYQSSVGGSQLYALKQTWMGGTSGPASFKTPTPAVPLSLNWIQAGTSSGSRLTASPRTQRTSARQQTEAT